MVRKSIMFLACGLILNTAFATENYHSIGFSNPASTSGTSGTSGFVGPDAGGQISVKDLLSQAQDNTRVILTGHIIKRVSHDTYMFTDGTGANGYLLDQFLQDSTNHRQDEYGGSLENRAKLMLEITDAVISIWGADRVGMHPAPRGDSNDMGDSDPIKTFTYIAKEPQMLKGYTDYSF
jgi:uncharacterized protein (TIGR00156 family)